MMFDAEALLHLCREKEGRKAATSDKAITNW